MLKTNDSTKKDNQAQQKGPSKMEEISGCRAIDPLVGVPYGEAVSHQADCQHQLFLCPFNCHKRHQKQRKLADGLPPDKLIKHISSECPFSQTKCKTCKATILKRKADSHSCF